MYSDAQGFQQLAALAMAASSAMAAQARESEVSECPSTVSHMEVPSYGMPSSPTRRKKHSQLRQLPRPSPVRPPSSVPADPAPHGRAPTPAAPLNPPFFSLTPEPRRSRRSNQSRRSDQVYTPRHSVVHIHGGGGGRKSVVAPRGSVASILTTPWDLDEDEVDGVHEEVDAFDWDVPAGYRSGARRRRWMWTIALPFTISLVFTLCGVLYLVYGSDKMIKNLQIWRLCFFIAGLPVIWWVGEGLTLLAVWFVERSMFTVRNALYYAYATRRPLANVVRAAFALGWWAFSMTAWNKQQDQGVKDAIQIVLKVLACITLFMTANLIKTLMAKLLSSKFNKERHARKIQESLVKEYYLHMMLQPRTRSSGEDANGLSCSVDVQVTGTGRGGGGDQALKTSGSALPAVTTVASRLGRAFTSSLGGVANTLFTSKPIPCKGGMSTASEELLRSNAVAQQTPSQTGTVTVDIQVLQNEKAAGSESAPPGKPRSRQSSIASRGGVDNNNNNINNLHNNTHTSSHAAAMRRAPSARRISRLAPVMEEIVIEGSKRRGLSANQLAKMEHYIRKQALQVTFRDELNATEHQEEVTNTSEAKKMALYLFWNVKADLERPFLIADDVADFLPPGEAEEAFAIFDQNGNGRVTLQECINIVLGIFAARCDLALSLKDTRSVIGKLESVIGVVVHIIFVFLYLIVFQVDVVKTYLALSSLVLAFSFVFQNSIRTMYENVVFLFIVHPYDVGDYLMIGEGSTSAYRVDQIDLHYTIFVSGSGLRTWFPNQKLISTPFANVSVSGERGDSIRVLIDMETPAGALDQVREACEAVALAQPTEFAEGVSLHLRDATAPMKVTLALYFTYTHNGSDAGRCSRARTAMHAALSQALVEAGVRYTTAPSKDNGPSGFEEEYEEGNAAAATPAAPLSASGEDKRE